MEERIKELEEENRKLREFKAKQEEMMFLIGASLELAKPKTYRDAENLQKGKEIYEKLYKKELYYLKEKNKTLEEKYERLKADYIKLSKIVEINGGYRASYVNELRDKIAKLEQFLLDNIKVS